MPRSVEGHAVLRARGIIRRDALLGAARGVPEVRGIDVVVRGQLVVEGLAPVVGAGDLRSREDPGSGQHRTGHEHEYYERRHEGAVERLVQQTASSLGTPVGVVRLHRRDVPLCATLACLRRYATALC